MEWHSHQPEIERLLTLISINASIRKEEVDHLQDERYRLGDYFAKAVVLLDAVRVIWRGAA